MIRRQVSQRVLPWQIKYHQSSDAYALSKVRIYHLTLQSLTLDLTNCLGVVSVPKLPIDLKSWFTRLVHQQYLITNLMVSSN